MINYFYKRVNREMYFENRSQIRRGQHSSIIRRPRQEQIIMDRIYGWNQETADQAHHETPSVILPETSRLNLTIKHPSSIDPFVRIPDTKQIFKRQTRHQAIYPEPPPIRSKEQKQNLKNIRNLKRCYKYLWILVCQENHEAVAPFIKLFEDHNSNKKLYNLLKPEECMKIYSFLKEKMQIKIIADENSSKEIKLYFDELKKEEKEMILEIIFEQGMIYNWGRVRSPFKVIANIKQFVENDIKEEISKIRIDMPFYNFVHLDSSAQLFNRRSIVQGCLAALEKDQFIKNAQLFKKEAIQDENNQKKESEKELNKKKLGNVQKQQEHERIHNQFNRELEIVQGFQTIIDYLRNYFPIHKAPENTKNDFYEEIICQYVAESSIYKVLNNTIRFALNQDKIKIVSTLLHYLYGAIQYLFITRYREINFHEVYRGGRVSLVEQKEFRKGRYLWNLGFMSTSEDKKIAKGFQKKASEKQKEEGVLFTIKIPNEVLQLTHLEDQQGFFPIHKLSKIPNGPRMEVQVLFNPLNTFQIIDWDDQSKQLFLEYAPHIKIKQKKARNEPISQTEQQFLNNIFKLKNKDYDKGVKCLEEGDPFSAIVYYENSQNNGDELSDTQKQTYIEGLKSIGDLKKIDELLQAQIQDQNSKINELQKGEQTIEKIVKEVSTFKLYEDSVEFEAMNEKAEKIVQSIRIIKSIPTYENLMVEIRGYSEVSNVKLRVNETLSTIQSALHALKRIDLMSKLNVCTRIRDFLQQLKQFEFEHIENFQKLKKIKQEKLDIDFQKEKNEILQNYNEISDEAYFIKVYEKFNPANQKERHDIMENYLKEYFAGRREKKNQRQELEVLVLSAFSQFDNISLKETGNMKETTEKKTERKKLNKILYEMVQQYRQLLNEERKVYDILYSAIYKTSMSVKQTLESYLFFLRSYQQFITETEHPGSIQVFNIVQKHGEVMIEYNHIFESKIASTQYKFGNGRKKNQQAREILKNLSQKKGKKNKTVIHTQEKTKILQTLAASYKNDSLESQKFKKSAMNAEKVQPEIKTSEEIQLQEQKKTESFTQLIKILNDISKALQEDKNISQVVAQLNVTTQKIEVRNESRDITYQEPYESRLKQCSLLFSEVQSLIKKEKYEEIMKKNLNMCHLMFLMAENQYKLGFIQKCQRYIKRCEDQLLQIFKKNSKKNDFDIKKLMYGNKTFIGIYKLKAHLVATNSKKDKIKLFIKELKKAKNFMSEAMHEKFHEAEICEAIGFVEAQLFILYKQLTYEGVKGSVMEAIHSKDLIYGTNNTFSAKNYTLLMEISYQKEESFGQRTDQFYEKGKKIYLKLNPKDPLIIIQRYIHEYKSYLMRKDISKARKSFKSGVGLYLENQNHSLFLEVVMFIFNGLKKLYEDKNNQEKVKWLKLCLNSAEDLQRYVVKIYEKDKEINEHDKNGVHKITSLKIEILEELSKTLKKQNNPSYEEYERQILQTKKFLEELLKD